MIYIYIYCTFTVWVNMKADYWRGKTLSSSITSNQSLRNMACWLTRLILFRGQNIVGIKQTLNLIHMSLLYRQIIESHFPIRKQTFITSQESSHIKLSCFVYLRSPPYRRSDEPGYAFMSHTFHSAIIQFIHPCHNIGKLKLDCKSP